MEYLLKRLIEYIKDDFNTKKREFDKYKDDINFYYIVSIITFFVGGVVLFVFWYCVFYGINMFKDLF